jgi:regulator of replication initiation timing
VPAAQRSSDASLRQRLEGLLDENRRLRQENAKLREELALAYGHQREARTAPPTADHAG